MLRSIGTLIVALVVGIPAVVTSQERAPTGSPGWTQPEAAREEVRGTVRARRRVVLHPPIAGTLKALHVEEGQRVQEGELLAEMDADVQRAKVVAAEQASKADADRRDARAALAEAESLAGRTRAAFENGAATEWEKRQSALALTRARAALDAANERISRDRARLDVERQVLSQYEVRAPFAGTVTRLEFDAGSSLSREDALLVVIDLSELEAVLFVPVRDYAALKVGSTVALDAGPPLSRPVSARLLALDPEIDPGSQTVRAVFVVDNGEGRLPAGFPVRWRPAASPQVGANAND